MSKETVEKLQEDKRHLSAQICEVEFVLNQVREELKSTSAEKAAALNDVQLLQKEVRSLTFKWEEAKHREQDALCAMSKAEREMERMSLKHKEKIKSFEQDMSRCQQEIARLRAIVNKQEERLLDRKEEVVVKDEAIRQLEHEQYKIRGDCSTRASNIEWALSESKRKCAELERELQAVKGENRLLKNDKEGLQIKTKVPATSSIPNVHTTPKASGRSGNEAVFHHLHRTHPRCHPTSSGTFVLAATSTPSGTPTVSSSKVLDWDVSTVLSDYQKLQQEHQCLRENFEQTTNQLNQLRSKTKESDAEHRKLRDALDTLQEEHRQTEARLLIMKEEMEATNHHAKSVKKSEVVTPEQIREGFETKLKLHNVEQELSGLRKEYHAKNAELLDAQSELRELQSMQPSHQQDTAKLREQYNTKAAELAEAHSCLKELQSCLSTKDTALAHLEAQLSESSQKLHTLTITLEKQKKKAPEVEAKVVTLCHEKAALEEQLYTAQSELTDAQEQLVASKESHLQQSEKCEALANSLERVEQEKEQLEKALEQENVTLHEEVLKLCKENTTLEQQLQEAEQKVNCSLQSRLNELESALSEKTAALCKLEEELCEQSNLIISFKQQLSKHQNETELERKKTASLVQQVASMQQGSTHTTDRLHHLLEEVEEAEKRNLELMTSLEKKTSSERAVQVAFDALKLEHKKLSRRVDELEGAVNMKDAVASELHEAEQLLRQENEKLRCGLTESRQALHATERELVQTKTQLANAQRELQQHETALLEVQCNHETLLQDKNRMQEDVDQLNEALSVARSDYDKANHALSAMRSDYLECQYSKQELEDHSQELRKTIQFQQEEIASLQEKCGHVQQQLEALEWDLESRKALLEEAEMEMKTMLLEHQENEKNSNYAFIELQEHAHQMEDKVCSLEHELWAARRDGEEQQQSLDTLQRQLSAAVLDKSQLAEDVEVQKKEIASLRSKLESERSLLHELQQAVVSFKTPTRHPRPERGQQGGDKKAVTWAKQIARHSEKEGSVLVSLDNTVEFSP